MIGPRYSKGVSSKGKLLYWAYTLGVFKSLHPWVMGVLLGGLMLTSLIMWRQDDRWEGSLKTHSQSRSESILQSNYAQYQALVSKSVQQSQSISTTDLKKATQRWVQTSSGFDCETVRCVLSEQPLASIRIVIMSVLMSLSAIIGIG